MILGQPLFFSVQGFNFGKANIKTWRPGSPHFPRTEACSKIRVQLSSQPEQIDKLERRRQYLEVEVKALSKEKVPQGGGGDDGDVFFFAGEGARCCCFMFFYYSYCILLLLLTLRQDPEVCPDSQRASGQAKMTMTIRNRIRMRMRMRTKMMMMMMMMDDG